MSGVYHARAPEAMRARGAPEVVIDGEVEADQPRKLVQTWRPLWDPELKAEGAKHLTWEIADIGEGIATLTVTHELDGAPKTAVGVAGAGEGAPGAGGWPWVLSDLKTLLETGKSMYR